MFWKTSPSNKPSKRGVYAVHHGDFAGELLVYITSTTDSHEFLAIPHNINRSIPIASFESGWNSDIIRFVESLPKDIHKTATAQFKYNANQRAIN